MTPPSGNHNSFFHFAQELHVENRLTKRVGPMVLYPAQVEWARAVSDERDARGRRRYRRGVFSMPKMAGKTALGAAAGLYMLLCDPFETDREVYSIATDLEQARLIYQGEEKMVRRSPLLASWGRLTFTPMRRDDRVGYEGNFARLATGFIPLAALESTISGRNTCAQAVASPTGLEPVLPA